MVIMTKIWTICAVVIYTSLQPIICQFMAWHIKPWVAYALESLFYQIRMNTTHPIKIWNWKGITYWHYQVFILKNHWKLMKYFILKIIEKPRHGNMRYTKCHIRSLGRRDNNIYLYDSLTGPIKSGCRKFLDDKMQPEAWSLIISLNMGGQERFVIITQVSRSLRWTQKDKILIL